MKVFFRSPNDSRTAESGSSSQVRAFATTKKSDRRRPSSGDVAIANEVEHHLASEGFAARFPSAAARLADAQRLLWQLDPSSDLTTIGHKLREAIQQFATALVDRYAPADVNPDPAKTKNRLLAVLALHSANIGERRASLLAALAGYQDAVNDFVQRQERGDQKPGDPLTWEDARAAVFHTALVMYEFDRLIR
jgi:AcrR family transcriptional regulator